MKVVKRRKKLRDEWGKLRAEERGLGVTGSEEEVCEYVRRGEEGSMMTRERNLEGGREERDVTGS